MKDPDWMARGREKTIYNNHGAKGRKPSGPGLAGARNG